MRVVTFVQDADVMWIRNPFPRFDKFADFQIACDAYTGIPEDMNNRPNGGFVYARSNKRTIDFYNYWYMSRVDHPGLHDQDVLGKIKTDQDFLDIGLQLRFLDTLQFSGFCQARLTLNSLFDLFLELYKLIDLMRLSASIHAFTIFESVS